MNLTQEERDSVLFYQGATSAISPKPESLQAFYAIPNIYELMNTFLFPGCANERARFLMEHRTVNLTAINHMSELLLVYKQLYQAICKQASPAVTRTYHTYRKDRIDTLIHLKAGTFPSFCSTSTNANISPAYRKKAGLLLLELLVPDTVPHLNFQEVFGAKNTKPDEQETAYVQWKNDLQVYLAAQFQNLRSIFQTKP